MMGNKLFLVIFLTLLVLPFASADVIVKKNVLSDIIIKDANKSAEFKLEITNMGGSGNFEIYSFLMDMTPTNSFYIANGETKTIDVTAFPQYSTISHSGNFNFPFIIKGADVYEDDLTVNMQNLNQCFETGATNLEPGASKINVYLYNNKNTFFEDLNVKFSSTFFDVSGDFDLGPYEKKEFTVNLEKEDYNKLLAGTYDMKAEIAYAGITTDVTSKINFLEKEDIKTTDRTYGIFISERIIKKSNEGNVPADVGVSIKKNIITRLFTFVSPEPNSISREGIKIFYAWEDKVKPGEELEVNVQTNWFFPLLLILLVVVIVLFVKRYTRTDLMISKRAQFVRAKGGAFGLKITVHINAKKFVERITIRDKLPPLTKLLDRFGFERPSRIDEKKGVVEWYLSNMDKGESRTFSYMIYSKIGVIGKFALPRTVAFYQLDGEDHNTDSNQVFYITEPLGKPRED